MLRPVRMIAASVICTKQDVDGLLKALSDFGELHIEESADNSTPVEYNLEIQKAEESLSSVNDLHKQLSQEKPGALDLFKTSEPKRIQVTADNWQSLGQSIEQQVLVLKKEVDELNNSSSSLQEKAALLNAVKETLLIINENHVDLEAMQNLELIRVIATSVPEKNVELLKSELAKFPIIFNRTASSKKTFFVWIAVPVKQGAEVEKIVKAQHGEVFSIPKDLPHNNKDALKEINDRLEEINAQEKDISDSFKKLSVDNKGNLPVWKETVENVLVLLKAKKKMLQSGRLATIKGYVPNKNLDALNEKVHSLLGEKAIVLQGVKEKAKKPTKISNNRFVKPFEEITKLYGFPRYDEVDPTPIMAISFPIIFGLMFGDIGDGLVLMFGGLAFGLVIKKNQGIKNLAYILALCGLAATIAGALFGEFFGTELPPPFPLWFNPFALGNVFDFLVFALVIGVIQIVSGLILEMANFVLKHDLVDAIFTSLPRIAFYLGGVYLVVVYKLDFGLWLSSPILVLIVPFIVLVIGKPAYVAISKFYASKKGEHAEEAPESIGQRIFEGGDFVTRLLGNTISYSRILALLMAHWALLLVTYTVAALVGGPTGLGLILSGIIIVGGNIFVIAFEGLIVFIHTLRLHFYEWFSKFYNGDGIEFHPYKQNFVYTAVALKGKRK